HSKEKAPARTSWLIATAFDVPESTAVQFLGSSQGPLRIELNGKLVYQRDEARSFQPDSDRFEATLAAGENRVVVTIDASSENSSFHLRFRRKGSTEARERLVQLALARPGDLDHGRQVFLKVEKSQCLKC